METTALVWGTVLMILAMTKGNQTLLLRCNIDVLHNIIIYKFYL